MFQRRIQSSSHNVLTCLMFTQNALQLNFDIVLECLHLANCNLTCLNKTVWIQVYCVHQLYHRAKHTNSNLQQSQTYPYSNVPRDLFLARFIILITIITTTFKQNWYNKWLFSHGTEQKSYIDFTRPTFWMIYKHTSHNHVCLTFQIYVV